MDPATILAFVSGLIVPRLKTLGKKTTDGVQTEAEEAPKKTINTQADRAIKALRKKLPDNRALMAAFEALKNNLDSKSLQKDLATQIKRAARRDAQWAAQLTELFREAENLDGARFQVDQIMDANEGKHNIITIKMLSVPGVSSAHIVRLFLFILVIVIVLTLVWGVIFLSPNRGFARLQSQMPRLENQLIALIRPVHSKDDAEYPLAPEEAAEFERLNARIEELFRKANEEFNQAIAIRLEAQLARAAGFLLLAHFDQAEEAYRAILAVEPENTDAITGLGIVFYRLAQFDNVEPLFRRALKIDEALFGPGHTAVAIDLNNLASLLQDTNRHTEAEPLYRRALEIDEASLGADHPTVGTRLNNLGLLLQATNRNVGAEPLLRRALQIAEASFGPDHPKMATALNNLATLLLDTNRQVEAEPLFRRALEINEATFGPHHPQLAPNLNNLASLLQDANRHAEAEPLIRRALKINETSLGPDHPDVAIHLNTLAGLLQDTHRHVDAEPLQRRAVEIAEASFGPDHPTVAIFLNNLGRLLQATDRHAEAEPLFRRAWGIYKESFGDQHPTTQHVKKNLETLLEFMKSRPKNRRPAERNSAP